jgi:hypothetical protein
MGVCDSNCNSDISFNININCENSLKKLSLFICLLLCHRVGVYLVVIYERSLKCESLG